MSSIFSEILMNENIKEKVKNTVNFFYTSFWFLRHLNVQIFSATYCVFELPLLGKKLILSYIGFNFQNFQNFQTLCFMILMGDFSR